MKKTVVILVDGLDPEVLQSNLAQLPHIGELIDQGEFCRMNSVFPPDSIPAWTTIYTGLNPGEHGIFESFDYLQLKQQNISYDSNVIRGNTFWDKISRQGYKVGIFNPFLAYPSWEVNGFMLCGPIFESGTASSNRPDLLAKHSIPSLGAVVDIPNRSVLKEFLADTMELTRRQNELALQLFREEKCDFFFYGSLTLDRIKHFYWKFTDPTDPKYPGPNPYQAVVLDIYREIDRLIGELRQLAGDEYCLILMSDHGHQRRVTKTFNLNEWLRRNGYIQGKRDFKALVEMAKNSALDLFDKLDITEVALRQAKKIPGAKQLKSSDFVLKKDRKIYVPRFAGMNPYGGIVIHQEKFNAGEYRTLVAELITKLTEVRDPKTKERIVEWAGEREAIYKGRNIDKFPQVVFKLNDDYGVNRSLFTRGITGINPFHSNLSGGHRKYGTFIVSEKMKGLPDNKTVEIEAVHDLILKIFFETD
ncbi:MAG TPA: alkaline phosphatase family protein [Bacillota bacterium]|nr:alkaline phosphatase family protein [Bacillota bacterium]